MRALFQVVVAIAVLFVVTVDTNRAPALAAGAPAYAPQPGDERLGADAAIAKGLAEAQAKDWNGAIRYFTAAHRASPTSAPALYNLALAEAQVPGRELRAICWFEAYLALQPNAQNAAAVRGQIAELMQRSKAQAKSLMAAAEAATKLAPAQQQQYVSNEMGPLEARLGNFDAALSWQAVAEAAFGFEYAASDYEGVLKAVAQWPDAVKARVRAWRVDDLTHILGAEPAKNPYAAMRYRQLIDAQIAAGRLQDAERTLGALSDYVQTQSTPSYVELIKAQLALGHRAEATATLAKLKQAAAGPCGTVTNASGDFNENLLSSLCTDVAKADIALGALPEAQTALEAYGAILNRGMASPSARTGTALRWDDYFTVSTDLAKAYVKAGDSAATHAFIAAAFAKAAAEESSDAVEGALARPSQNSIDQSPAVTHAWMMEAKVKYLVALLDLDPPTIDHRREVLIIRRKIDDMAHDWGGRRMGFFLLAKAEIGQGDFPGAQADLAAAQGAENDCEKPDHIDTGLVTGCTFSLLPSLLAELPDGSGQIRAYFARLPTTGVGRKNLKDQPDYIARVEQKAYATAAVSAAKAAFASAPPTPTGRAAAWDGFVTHVLAGPLFVDFTGTIKGLTQFRSQDEGFKSAGLVEQITDRLNIMLDRQDDIAELSARPG